VPAGVAVVLPEETQVVSLTGLGQGQIGDWKAGIGAEHNWFRADPKQADPK
jgi:hypothetical protein